MRKERGLTLVELAIVLIVLGILLGIGAGIVGVLIKRVKYNESKEIVNAAVEGIVGYVISTTRLPTDSELPNTVRTTYDSYGKPLAYVYDSNLASSNICTATSTNISIEICPDTTCSSPVQTINNVAFVVISGDGNYNNQTEGTLGVNSPTTIKVYDYGVIVDDYPNDINRQEPYDDIVKWVSLNELKPKAGCVGSGGSGGGGGGGGACVPGSPITVNNVGGNRTVRVGTVSFFFCTNLSSCQSFTSVSVGTSTCVFVYTGSNCNNLESAFDYSDASGADANNDCIVNYNNGSLTDN